MTKKRYFKTGEYYKLYDNIVKITSVQNLNNGTQFCTFKVMNGSLLIHWFFSDSSFAKDLVKIPKLKAILKYE